MDAYLFREAILDSVNLEIKVLSQREAASIYLRSVRIAVWELLIQAEAQMVLPLRTEARGIYGKGKEDN